MRVCFLDSLEDRVREFPGEYLSGHQVSYADGSADRVPVDTEALITWSELLDSALLDRLSSLKLVQRIGYYRGGGDLVGARARGAHVAVWPKGVSNRVAMHAHTFMLVLSRQTVASHHATVQGENEIGLEPERTTSPARAMNWPMIKHVDTPSNKTVGIIGFGEIGACFARMTRPFDMDTLYYKRTRLSESQEAFYAVEYASLDDLLARSDYVVSFVPYTAESERMLGAREFELMKQSAYFINAGRGNTVDEDALIDMLKRNRIRGAGLDVFSIEPVPADHPVLKLSNVVLTPHNAGGVGGWHDVFTRLKLNLEAVSAGRAPRSWEIPPSA